MILAAVVASGQHLRHTALPVQQRRTSLYASISISVVTKQVRPVCMCVCVCAMCVCERTGENEPKMSSRSSAALTLWLERVTGRR